jgi:hypothetical protein
MADENKPAFYPRVGNIKAKNFRSAKPMPFIDDERAMELPQYSENIRGLGGVDLSVPTKQNLELNRRITQRDADLMRQVQADRSIPEKLAGGLQAGRFMGSALTQAINSLPTRIAKGDEAADKFIQERIYKPEQPLAYEYAQDVGDFLEKLETEYKIPPVLPEAVALQYLTAPATSQATRAAGRGAEQAGMALERSMEPVVRGALEQGGLPREMAMAMGANTQSNVIKPKGGNWLGNLVDPSIQNLKTRGNTTPEQIADFEAHLEKIRPDYDLSNPAHVRELAQMEDAIQTFKNNRAIDKWVDSNLTNYIKKEMGTPEDPVRRLAEEGISHLPRDLQNPQRMWTPDELAYERKKQGFPEEGVGIHPTAQMWEQMADQAIYPNKAGDIQQFPAEIAKRDQAVAKYEEHLSKLNERLVPYLKSKGLNDTQVEGMMRLPDTEKANILNDKTLNKLFNKIPPYPPNTQFLEEAGAKNPWITKLDPSENVYSGNIGGLNFDHIVDVLRQDVEAGRIRPDQLNKVSMEQAVRRTYEFDQDMARRMRDAQLKQQEGFPLHKEYPEGFRWIELAKPKVTVDTPLPEGFRWLEPKGGYERLEGPSILDPQRTRTYLGDTKEQALRVAEERSMLGSEQQKMLEDALKYEGDTMGHCVGGYCPDVLAGNTRIFSLRDAKGEPHVTIETRPNRNQLRADDLLPYKEAALEEAKRLPNGYTDADLRDIEIRMARENMPQNIIQIKGKGNAKPKDDYIPYVQDFVKSGNWAQVGDFRNTGLRLSEDAIGAEAMQALKAQGVQIPKYVTQEEAIKMSADAMSKAGTIPPPAGMKRGGKVSISNNPDAMMLELNNQKMKNGEPAYAGGKAIIKKGLQSAPLPRAVPKTKTEIEAIAQRMAPQMLGEFVRKKTGSQSVAEKTQKQFAKEKEMKHDIRPTGAERPLPREVDIEELKDQVMIGIAGDPTISGQTLYSVDGVPLDSPSPQHGGPLYGLGHEGDAFWASGLSAANRVQNVAREASEQYDLPVLGNYVMMGPDSINYAQHYADANLAAINPAKMSKSQIEDFNNLVRRGSKKSGPRPSFPGIENPSEAYLHFSIDPELRKHFNALMQMPTVTEKYNLPSGIDVRHAVTEPDLRDLEIGVTGKSIGRLRPEVSKLGLSEHPTYSHDIPGEFIGSSKYPVPYELSFPDTVKSVRENPKQAPQEFGSFKYVGPRQVIDQQLIDEIKQYQEMIKKYTGKKEGGYIKKPAAYLNGDEFVNAAKKYGIKDSMNNLNKIVDLVNKGLSVDDAARQVADSGTHKAAGGAIRGDDLILEERPL